MIETGEKAIIGSLKRARRTGQLTLIGLELKEFPKQIAQYQDLQLDDNWWEIAPLTKLDLSNNEIKQIPEDFTHEKEIQLVRMLNNKLFTLPNSLFQLTQLKSIDFSKNQIKQLPYSLVQCPSLVEINLSENKIEELPMNMHYLQNLEILNLSQNNLRAVPIFLEKTPLKKVDLSENKISHIPQPAFSGCLLLENLILSKNLIQQIDEGAFQNLKSLVNLYLDQNRLVEFQEVPQSEKLDQLVLSYNRIESFTQFENIPNLSALVINNNKLKNLDKSILICKNIKTLDLTNNDLPDIPSEIGLLPKLVRFTVEGNPLKCIRNTIKNAGAEAIKKYLRDRIQGDYTQVESAMDPKMNFIQKKLDPIEVLLREFYRNNEFIVSNQNLTKFDDERLYNLKGLTHLDISNNKIQIIPEQLVNYEKSLSKLHANNNNLIALPQSILQLRQLQSLEFKQNNIEYFFDNNSQLKQCWQVFPNLQHLDLSINKLKSISGLIISFMPSLRVLNLAYNQISDLSPLFSTSAKLNKLEVIDVSNNSLQELSEQIAYTLPMLQNLNLENNNLQKIPTELGFMKLKTLKIDGNPLKLIKRAVIEKGTVSILDYLRTRHVGNPPTDLACMRPVVEEIEEQPEQPQANILRNNDYQYRRQNHQYGQLQQQPVQQQQPNYGFGRGNLFKQNQNDLLFQQQQSYNQERGGFQKVGNMEVENYSMQYTSQQNQVNQQRSFDQVNQGYNNQQQFNRNMQVEDLAYNNNPNAGQIKRANKAEIEKQIYLINGSISKLENELAENFSLNKFQINEKRKELQALKLQRSKLQQDLQ
ncbi:hypothetical protein TTHERM_000716187 (macronuclear) [Tetrahymena thermophila SB210]|uniref:Leucine rich repeat protein n=1 Tax=Tetrahymena thermophila (strain SB210) TaxID=312017 RepID=W7X306_TETTS|nr:hypothetical protein TTHERM_000716187 [Tetrahymena thermophila SB210]EWS71822.1 hypothetical protein TTHERM_000716187 [Tetrahymena thermophila SB210]|eukprot:XP_012655644.1 hypothetical protein TTHERM_000716187 [Tetrahymena thermophila SB210]